MHKQASQELFIFLELIGDVLIVDIDHAVDHGQQPVIAKIRREFLFLSRVSHLGATDVEEDIGQFPSGNQNLKFLFHGLQNPNRQIVVIPEFQVSHLRRNTLERRALLQSLYNNRYMDDQSCISTVRQLQNLGLIEASQYLVHPADSIAFQQGIDSAVSRVQKRLRKDFSGDIAAAVGIRLSGRLLDKAAHGLSVIALVAFQDHAVSRTFDDSQAALLQPGAEGVHIASCCRLTDAQQLTIVKEFVGRPVSEQLKQEPSAASLAICRIRILLIAQILSELLNVLRTSLDLDAYTLVIRQFQPISLNAQFEVLELSLHSSLADPDVICDLLLIYRPLAV